ncbi:MAG TPA: three-Cys-motif partner protein TcmP [Ignavibacteriaceae bacterium]|nr:three-Cys-motif partner protein TcmP [Ignavibacteriaceae bacterium]
MQVNEPLAKWGGDWTEKKLDAFSNYVRAYLTIMKNYRHFETIYFDGFAGCGQRTQSDEDSLVQYEINYNESRVYKGSAERVLNIKEGLSFDHYYFIDTDEMSLTKLESRLKDLPQSEGKNLYFRKGDANHWLTALSKSMKKNGTKQRAALVFLDPFGMQVNWESISSLTGTRTDLWILVPSGVIINRLLERSGELKHIEKLKSFFGLSEEEIKNEFYVINQVDTLFGVEEAVNKVLKPIEKIAYLYIKRLKTIWKYVTDSPLVLVNTKNIPIFHFVFASNNKTGFKIADYIIKNN